MNKLLTVSLAAFYGASAVAIDKANSLFHIQPESYDFATYVQEFDKNYDTEEEFALRKEIFSANLDKILALNAGFEQGERTWKAGVNKFTDLSAAEFTRFKGFNKELIGEKLKGDNIFRLENELDRNLIGFPEVSDFPTSVDWRTKKGVVTPVKDQGGCGSCWAFSSAETVESAVAIASGLPAPILAPQQYVDCVKNPDDCGGQGGCEGATQPLAFNYTIPVGLTSEAAYPYQGQDGTCKKNIKPVAGIKGMVVLATNNWTQLMAATSSVGPIAISVAAEPWQFYDSGVFSKDCGADIDHAVQAVGYGMDGSTPYWIVRNSWGEGWGEQGYIRVLRAASEADVKCRTDTTPGDGFGCNDGPKTITVCGECGILSGSSYVTGAYLYPKAPEVEEF